MNTASAKQESPKAENHFTCKLCKEVSHNFNDFLKHLKELCKFCVKGKQSNRIKHYV